ncbi:hypothetical protein [Sporomusa sp. GT1]|nr:hypothetical protein [Sporomusa sp. GT1]
MFEGLIFYGYYTIKIQIITVAIQQQAINETKSAQDGGQKTGKLSE